MRCCYSWQEDLGFFGCLDAQIGIMIRVILKHIVSIVGTLNDNQRQYYEVFTSSFHVCERAMSGDQSGLFEEVYRALDIKLVYGQTRRFLAVDSGTPSLRWRHCVKNLGCQND